MQNVKSCVFLYLTSRQKSQLLGTLKSYFKKFPQLSENDIIDKFLEDEKYYIDIGNPHFEFVKEYFNDDNFYNDLKKYFSFLSYEKKQLELMEPYKQKQKELMKEQRKRAQEFKMSKLKPTKKQLYYYEKLCKKYNIEQRKLTSKLEALEEIDKIINEHSVI